MADLTGIGTSALLAFQRSLSTVGHNISNATTEGFSRQRVSFATQTPEFTGAGYFGTGTTVDRVSRVYDQFIVDRLQSNTSNHSQTEHFLGLVSQVDNLLADESAGLSPALQGFFNSLQNSVDDPASTPARQVLLSDAEALTQRFHSIDTRLRELAENAERDLVNIANEINGLGASLARVNDAIVLGTQGGGRIQPNDLLDERDQILRELAELTRVETVEQDDGSLSVFVGSGQGLVVGDGVNEIQAVRNKFDPERYDLVIQQGQVQVNITDQLSGGRIGAVVDFRNKVLDPGLNALGRIATSLTETFNSQHKLGIDYNGNGGTDFFAAGGIAPVPGSNNTGTGSLAATLVDAGQLTTSNYEVVYDGSNYRVTRLNDKKVMFTGGLAALNATPIDGFQITAAAGAAAGDSFLIQPTRSAARDINLFIKDPALIAHAAPIRSSSATTNAGNAGLELAAVTDATTYPLAGDISLVFDPDALGAGVPGFFVSGGPGGTLAYDPATEQNGKQFTLGAPFDGISFNISGTPTSGDSFTITNNTNGIGDNRNGLSLAKLQSTVTVRGNNTFQSAFGELVADVGTRTRQAQITEEAQGVLLQQTEAERQSVSGVNLDEEAARLMQLQQAYQAAAQVISVSNSLFDEVLAALR
ncbi:flagellar hook-associated protein FlgK [Sulfuriflexus sp.]|uniref:flagellar hook-associated protein FlgK n=1 Tax=Sulfuriflexus sp. TaxID=2015443 RepID=UPI0028CDD568|nr:flagellar hook-associated protein FlgK [Sulfuriflexus sp.]MDT8404483.1 flagellar hook-associated protein FlgK [Sulfuriflexus sp.]